MESPDSAKPGRLSSSVQPTQDAAGVDRVQLARVAYQEDFGAGLPCLLHEGSELEGGNHRGFVDDDELIRMEAPSLLGRSEPGGFLRVCDAPALAGLSPC
jgi:hypothetical protein